VQGEQEPIVIPRAHHSISSVDRLSNEVSTTSGTVEIQDLNLQQWQRLVTDLAVSIPSTLSLKQRDRGLGGGGKALSMKHVAAATSFG